MAGQKNQNIEFDLYLITIKRLVIRRKANSDAFAISIFTGVKTWEGDILFIVNLQFGTRQTPTRRWRVAVLFSVFDDPIYCIFYSDHWVSCSPTKFFSSFL